jgi:hypothetical protein
LHFFTLSRNRRYQTFLHLYRHSKPGLKRLILSMLWILRTPLMRRTAPMVLVLAVLLSGGALFAAAQTKLDKLAPKPDKSPHKSAKSTGKSAKSAHAVPAASSRTPTPASSRGVSSRQTSRQSARPQFASSRTGSHVSATLAPTAHQSAHRVPPSAFPSRATSGRYASADAVTGRSRSGLSGRRTFRPRTAVLTSRSRLRSSLRDRELPQSPAPAPEAIALHRRDLGLASPLRGSRASLERQDEISEGQDGLERIQDEDDLQDRIAHNFLVPVPTSTDLTVNQNLPETHRYCRPWTAQFLADLARLHAERFHSSLEVSSAVRTVEYQKQLERINGNAAAAEGDVASPHLTGATIDIAKGNMTRDEIAWMRSSLLALQQAGKLDVEEEFKQACFHITVYRSYSANLPAAAPSVAAINSDDKPALLLGEPSGPANTLASRPTRSQARRRHPASHVRSRIPARVPANSAKPLPA